MTTAINVSTKGINAYVPEEKPIPFKSGSGTYLWTLILSLATAVVVMWSLLNG
jgi:hypothetical protein